MLLILFLVDSGEKEFDEDDVAAQDRNYLIDSDSESDEDESEEDDSEEEEDDDAPQRFVTPKKQKDVEESEEEEDPELAAERGQFYKPGARDRHRGKGKRGK